MTMKTEGNYTGEFLLSEANGSMSRETAVITGGDYAPGQVLGKVSASGKYTAHIPTATNGSQHAVAVLYRGVDTSESDKDGVIIARLVEVDDALLVWKDDITEAQKSTGISKLNENLIIVR